MPQPIVIEYNGLARGIEGAGNAIGDALGKVADEKRQRDKYQRDATILQDILKDADANMTIQQAQQKGFEAIKRGVSPEMVNSTLSMYKPIWEQNLKADRTDRLMNKLGIDDNQNQDFRQQNTQIDQYPQEGLLSQQYQQQQQIPQGNNPEGLMAQNVMNQGLQEATQERMSPITTIKDAQAFAKSPVEKQKEFVQQNSRTGMSRFSNDALLKMSLSGDPEIKNAVDTEIKLRDQAGRDYTKERAYHATEANKSIEKTNKLRSSQRSKEAALGLQRAAIETGETGPLSWANISKRLDIPELMNAAGTQLNQAGKEFFFGSMNRLSAKGQNQWMEQRISQLTANIGDPEASALMKQTILEGELALDKSYLESFDKLAAQDMKEFGYVRNDIEQRAYADSEDRDMRILNGTAFKTRQIYEKEKGNLWMQKNIMKKVPSGTYLTPQMIKIMGKEYKGDFEKVYENARKLGYTIPSQEEATQWTQ